METICIEYFQVVWEERREMGQRLKEGEGQVSFYKDEKYKNLFMFWCNDLVAKDIWKTRWRAEAMQVPSRKGRLAFKRGRGTLFLGQVRMTRSDAGGRQRWRRVGEKVPQGFHFLNKVWVSFSGCQEERKDQANQTEKTPHPYQESIIKLKAESMFSLSMN